MSLDTVPKEVRGLRACLVCSLIKTFDQFEYDGCDNCDEFLRMKNNKDHVYDCTSNNFDGMIAVMSPEDSWVCKWQRITLTKERKDYFNHVKAGERLPFTKCLNTPGIDILSLEKQIGDQCNVCRFCKGVYAISVSGRLPAGVIRDMKSRGIVYRPRDTSQR